MARAPAPDLFGLISPGAADYMALSSERSLQTLGARSLQLEVARFTIDL
jgi:hypothetical protein